MSNATISSFYASEGIRERLENALVMSGLSQAPIDGAQLALADQYHAGGLEATKAIGFVLGAKEDSLVLDIGSGFGGPARFLSKAYGCRVKGVDLTPEYVEISNYLTGLTGQSDKLSFTCGDALSLPFEDREFDHALTQHVGMNIEDKRRFYSEVFRVLKPGSKFAIYDIVRVNGEALTYPMPWAPDPSVSFVVRPDEVLQTLAEVGFDDLSAEDKSPLVSEAFAEFGRRMQSGQAPPLNLISLLGGQSKVAVQNLSEGLGDGRLSAQIFLAHKPLNA